MLVFDLSSDVCAFDETIQIIAFHQTASDSSNLTRATHQVWWKRLMSLVEIKSYQTCEK